MLQNQTRLPRRIAEASSTRRSVTGHAAVAERRDWKPGRRWVLDTGHPEALRHRLTRRPWSPTVYASPAPSPEDVEAQCRQAERPRRSERSTAALKRHALSVPPSVTTERVGPARDQQARLRSAAPCSHRGGCATVHRRLSPQHTAEKQRASDRHRGACPDLTNSRSCQTTENRPRFAGPVSPPGSAHSASDGAASRRPRQRRLGSEDPWSALTWSEAGSGRKRPSPRDVHPKRHPGCRCSPQLSWTSRPGPVVGGLRRGSKLESSSALPRGP